MWLRSSSENILGKSEKTTKSLLRGSSKTRKAKYTETTQKYAKYVGIVITELRSSSENILGKPEKRLSPWILWGSDLSFEDINK